MVGFSFLGGPSAAVARIFKSLIRIRLRAGVRLLVRPSAIADPAFVLPMLRRDGSGYHWKFFSYPVAMSKEPYRLFT
jgi:hypothetical protein